MTSNGFSPEAGLSDDQQSVECLPCAAAAATNCVHSLSMFWCDVGIFLPPPADVFLPQADLTDPTSLPATLVGVSAIIDCATARPEESTQKVDWEGKVALIQCAQVRRRLQGIATAVAASLTTLVAEIGVIVCCRSAMSATLPLIRWRFGSVWVMNEPAVLNCFAEAYFFGGAMAANLRCST